MIYTLGNASSYLECHKETKERNKTWIKRGRYEGYNGGSVWKTQKEVRVYINNHQPRLKGYAVFGVKADWNLETAPPKRIQMPWRDLLVDSEIVLLDNVDYEGVIKEG